MARAKLAKFQVVLGLGALLAVSAQAAEINITVGNSTYDMSALLLSKENTAAGVTDYWLNKSALQQVDTTHYMDPNSGLIFDTSTKGNGLWAEFSADPVIVFSFAIVNSTGSTTDYSVSFTQHIPALTGPNVVKSSLGLTVSDGSSNLGTATVSGVAGAPNLAVTGLSENNGLTLQNMLVDVGGTGPYSSDSTTGTQTYAFSNAAHAGPTAPGTGWNYMRTTLSFDLTAGDAAAFTGRAEINPVPVPAAVWLFGSALTGLVSLRRKLA
jgi:hypothetical protein